MMSLSPVCHVCAGTVRLWLTRPAFHSAAEMSSSDSERQTRIWTYGSLTRPECFIGANLKPCPTVSLWVSLVISIKTILRMFYVFWRRIYSPFLSNCTCSVSGKAITPEIQTVKLLQWKIALPAYAELNKWPVWVDVSFCREATERERFI